MNWNTPKITRIKTKDLICKIRFRGDSNAGNLCKANVENDIICLEEPTALNENVTPDPQCGFIPVTKCFSAFV